MHRNTLTTRVASPSQLRGPPKGIQGFSAFFIALYWVTFTVKSVVFPDSSVPGLFFPFYLGILGLVLVKLLTNDLRLESSLFWIFTSFLMIILVSLPRMDTPISGLTVQKLTALAIGPLVLLVLGTRVKRHWLLWPIIASGVAIAVWIILTASQGGFDYRANIEADENVAAFTLGLTLVMSLTTALTLTHSRALFPALGATIVTGLIAYAFLLLASRGMTLALGLAFVGLGLHLLAFSRRNFWFLLIALILGSSLLLLPGGDGVLERFQGESIESAGDRSPLWQAALSDFTHGRPLELLLGQGFGTSEVSVRRTTATLASTHNSYITMLFEFGVIGLLLFIALHVRGLRLAHQSGFPGLTSTALIWFLLGSSFSVTMHDDFLFWIALAVALALALQRDPITLTP